MYIIYTICCMFLVGFFDALEFLFVNNEVFYQHNFPDILNRRDFNNLDFIHAFQSGVMCSWILVIPLCLKCIMSLFKHERFNRRIVNKHLKLFFILILGNMLILTTYNRDHHSIYRNHKAMYALFAMVEFISLNIAAY